MLTAAAVPDCDRAPTALAQDECRLAESMALDPPPDCAKRTTQFDLNVCSFREYLRSDIELNRTWDAVGKRHKGSSVFRLVLDSQRAWLSYRDKQCDIWAKWYEGGTIASLVINTCLTDITKFRIEELKQLLDDN